MIMAKMGIVAWERHLQRRDILVEGRDCPLCEITPEAVA